MAEFLRTYTPKYFKAEELVSPRIIRKRGRKKALQQMNPHILYSMDTLRCFLVDLTPETPEKAALTVNNYLWGGGYTSRGLRVPGDDSYSDTSAHAKGNAVDSQSLHYPAEELRQIIINNRVLFPYVTRIEADVGWLHIDCSPLPENAPEGAIMLFYPDGRIKYV